MKRDLSQGRRKVWLRRAAWAVGIYAVIGFLILPLITKAVAVSQLKKLLNREVQIQSVRMNPFTLSATVRGLHVDDKDGETFIGWKEFHVNFQLSSLVGKSWSFKTVRLVEPYVRIQLNNDSSLNFSDLFADSKEEKPVEDASSGPFLLRIETLQLVDGRVSFTDLTPSTPFRRIIGPLDVSLTQFHTDPANKNPYSFKGTTDSGERFAWSGQFFLDPLSSDGSLSFDGISIPKFAPLFRDLVKFEVRDGVIGFHGDYRFAIGGSNYVASVSNAAFSLKSFKIGEAAMDENMVEIDSFAINNLNTDAAARGAEIGSVELDGARLVLKRAADTSINLVEASRPSDESASAPGGVMFLLRATTNAFAALIHSTNHWSATLHDLLLTNCAMHWSDASPAAPVYLPVDDIVVAARHISNIPGSNMILNASFTWNTNGSFLLESETSIHPASLDARLNLDRLELSPLSPYLQSALSLFVLGSKYSLDGKIEMRTGTDGLPAVTFRGDTRLDDFSTTDSFMNQDFVKWKTLSVSGIEAALNPPSLSAKEIALLEPFVLLAVQSNQVFNVKAMVKAGDTNASPPETGTAAAVSEAPASDSKGGLGSQLGKLFRQAIKPNANAGGSSPAASIAVGAIVVSNATLRFADYSTSPNVKAGIQELSGTISSISSTEPRPSELHFNAKVGASGTFDISGRVTPLQTNSFAELKILIKDVDLSPLSPYSAKYVGYRLNRGALNFDTDYNVSERKFTAKNILELDRLTFGQRVKGTNATTLPVKLAVGVLKDSEGKILLDIPIEGSLDDPQLRFRKVIARAIVNIITKIATSPFSMLGAVFGGSGQEVSYQDFAPGSDELQEANLKKLDVLLNGLAEKPGLNLAIEGSFDPVKDAGALRLRKLDRQFQRAKWNSLRESVRESTALESVVVAPDERLELLRKAYEQLLATRQVGVVETEMPEVQSSPPRPASGKAAETMMRNVNPPPPAPMPDMEKALLATIEVTDAELAELAAARARRVLKQITEAGRIEAERVSLAIAEEITLGDPAPRVYFHLQ
ncbi:MAG TPA: DUF748 domain-containing protein [Verrucomicrobiota bacterium]|nr:DUF748 domain-containing protein [Verrucomicrobiota bacterium]